MRESTEKRKPLAKHYFFFEIYVKMLGNKCALMHALLNGIGGIEHVRIYEGTFVLCVSKLFSS